MSSRAIRRVLLGALYLLALQAHAQVSEAESHILSAFTTGADPHVLADDVKVGPVLRAELGETDGAKLYQAMADRTAGRMLRVRLVPVGEAARFTSIPGVNATDPLVTLESGDLQLVLQYAPKEKHVAFIEQVSAPIARVAPPKPPVEVAKPPAPVEAPTPPPVVAVPAIPPVATPAPTFTPAPVPAAPPDRTTKPRGECVVKPVMNEEDLWNCSGPAQPAAAIERPAPPPVAVQKPQAAPERPASRPTGDCVIKPVMSDEDLRNCAAVSRSTPSTPPVVPVLLQKPEPPAPAAPRRSECVIKPVMTEEDLRNCAAVSTSTPSVPPVVPVAVQKPEPPAPAAPRPRADCVIKPVMSEEDLRNCAAVSTSAPKAAPVVPVTVQAPPPAAPAAPKPRAQCVIKPVMTEEDLRACGVRR